MKKLTEVGIDRLGKAPKGKRTHVFDSVAPGLAVRVTDSGAKSYVVVVRVRGRGRQIWITLPMKPGKTLTKARERAQEIREWADEGKDPRRELAAQRAQTMREDETTVASVFGRYMVRYERERKPATVAKVRAVFGADVLPKIGALPIRDVTKADILAILDAKADAGRGVAANRLRAYLRTFFASALERDLVVENVVAATRKPLAKERARERALTDAELRSVWMAAGALPWQASAAVRLLILLGQRPNEVAGMRWSELGREGETWLWRLPGERTKNGKDHQIALPRFAVDLIEGLPRFAGSDLVMGSNRRARVPGEDGETQPHSPTRRRDAHVYLGSKFKRALEAQIAKLAEEGAAPVSAWQWRDLRRSVATGMERCGISTRVVAAVLNHSPPGLGVTAVYARHEYQREAAEGLAQWARHVEGLIGAHVTPMMAKRA